MECFTDTSRTLDDEITTDMREFGYREKTIAAKLLDAYLKKPDVLGEGVTVAFNRKSSNVFLIDKDFRVAMINGQDLKEVLRCPKCAHETFKHEFLLH